MKKTLSLFAFMFVALIGLAFTSCDGKDADTIEPEDLPTSITTFLNTYYPGQRIMRSVKTNGKDGKYEIRLHNGHEIDFNDNGEWIDVDAPEGETIPGGIAPAPIALYVVTNYAGAGINEISKESYGYDVELTSGVDLEFDKNGKFLKETK